MYKTTPHSRSIILSIYVCVRRSAANKQQTKKTNSKPCAPCFSFFSFFSFFPTETKNGEHRQMTKANANSESRGMQVRAHRQHHTARQTDRAQTDSRHTATEHRQNRAHNDNELDSVE